MAKDVFIFAEQRDAALLKVAFELTGKGKELAAALNQSVVAVLLGSGVSHLAPRLIAAGADKVLTADDPALSDYMTEPYAKALAHIIRAYEPEVFLIGATAIGRDLAPRVSARVRTGLTADCTGLEIDEASKNLLMTRPAFGGNIMATITCENHRPQMATVRPGVMKALPLDETRNGIVEAVAMEFTAADKNVRIIETVKETKKRTDITEAKTLVSGGRGMGAPENMRMLSDLAAVLGGDVSASRAAVDAGWAERDRQVGQTGKTVRPDLYFACGISGAIQHVAGMDGAGFIIAVNKNATAPIFDVADIGIVGDAAVILPKLTAELKAIKAARANPA